MRTVSDEFCNIHWPIWIGIKEIHSAPELCGLSGDVTITEASPLVSQFHRPDFVTINEKSPFPT
jgi:hypothetical protein